MLGLDIDQVHVEIGDSDLPFAPYSGGSGMATSLSETYVDMLARHGLPEMTAWGERDPDANGGPPPNGSFAARSAKSASTRTWDCGASRGIVSTVDAGRILNEKLARSQIIGGTVIASE